MVKSATLLTGSHSLLAGLGDPAFFKPYWDAILEGYWKGGASIPEMMPALAAYVASGRDKDGKALAHLRTANNLDPWTRHILGQKVSATHPKTNYVGDGWYASPAIDFETFWTHCTAYLQWREISGKSDPEQDARVLDLMQTGPLLLAPNGSQPLFGRSISYRWAFVTPMVLAYRQGLWPHSPGLLRLMVRRNIDFFWRHGGFADGRLNTAISDRGTDQYADPGSPYHCMSAFAFLLIPPADPFWSAPEEKVPCELKESATALTGPKLLITNHVPIGDVRVHFAANGVFDTANRDRFAKFSYSARFPFCYTKQPGRATWDAALVFYDPETNEIAGRAGITSGTLIDGGVETDWFAIVRGRRINVLSRVYPDGEKERRVHIIRSAPLPGIEIWEGSTALPVAATEPIKTSATEASAAGGTVGILNRKGHDRVDIDTDFTSTLGRKTINLIAPRSAIVTLRTKLRQPTTHLEATFLCRPYMPKGGYK